MEHLTAFEKEFLQKVDDLKDSLIRDVISLINVPSKKADSIEGAPFGIELKYVLDKAMDMAKREGMVNKNIDNYMAYASVGHSDNYIGILGHLDVVDEGDWDSWTYPPFDGEIHDNKIYGRGALDNKGPIMAAFYGLIALKNTGYDFKNEIRIIFGTDEESGMSDLDYYLDRENPPIMGFVPDNKFPAIYGERGRADIEIRGDVDDFFNTYLVNQDEIADKLDINYKDLTFGNTMVKRVEKTDNSIRMIISTPVVEIEELIDKIKAKAENLEVELVKYYEPAIKSRDSLLVSTLNMAYNDITGENISPTTTTGVTYAHYCPNVIGFGPSFPGQNGISHAPDEWMDIDDLIKMAKIYALAIYRLDQLNMNR